MTTMTTARDTVEDGPEERVRRARAGRTDGRFARIGDADLVRGNVLCSVGEDGGTPTFSDCLIVDVFWINGMGHRCLPYEKGEGRLVRLARPYAYVSGAETGCPSVLQAFEDYTVYPEDLTGPGSRYRLRVRSTGEADRRTT